MIETFKAYVTKYALTEGIFCVDASICHVDTMIEYKGEFSTMHMHGNDWHRTLDEAIERAEEMRDKKIQSLEKSIAKLKKMEFRK